MAGRNLAVFFPLVLALTGLCVPILIPSIIAAETPTPQIVMSLGPLWSCGDDNLGQVSRLCSRTDVLIYRLIPAVNPDTDYYVVYFTVEGGNYVNKQNYNTGGTYITEVSVSLDIRRPASLTVGQSPWPNGGCTDGSTREIQTWGKTFSLPGIDGCTELSTVYTTDRQSVNWHLCASIPDCPYSAISRDYTGFLFSVTVPKGESPSFTLDTKTTVAKLSGCCLRDILATGEVIWSPQSQIESATTLPPPPPQFVGQWYLIAALAIIPFGGPLLVRKTSGKPSTPRPIELGILVAIGLTLGSLVLIATWDILPFPSSSIITAQGYRLVGFMLGFAMVASALGIWLGQEWARLLAIALNSLSVLVSLLNILSFNPLQWVASLLSILIAAYIIRYMVRPDVKRFFSRPTTGGATVSTNEGP